MKCSKLVKQRYHPIIFSVITLVIITIFSCGKEKNDKAQWYTDALSTLPAKYGEVKIAIVYHERFVINEGDTADLRIDSSPEALNAYQDGVGNDYFIEHYDPGSNQKIVPPTEGCYIGVFPGWGQLEDSVDIQLLADFENLAGKAVALSPFSNFWGQNYAPTEPIDEIESYGAVPLLRLMPWGEPYWTPGYQPDFALQKIIDGEFDSLLSDIANAVINYGKPVMATFGVEMNGNWFPWSGVFQGADTTDGYGDSTKTDGPERYVNAFRHIIDLFRILGADNVTWVFQPNHQNIPDESWNTIEAYYPGDNYIDWIGFSLYGAQSNTEDWVTFEEVMEPIYHTLTSLFPNKPLMMAEWGVREP